MFLSYRTNMSNIMTDIDIMTDTKDIKKAIILAAGYGTRFLPETKAMPKEMLPLVDKPVIQYIVEEAVASGIKEIILVTGKSKRAIEDHFDYAPELESFLESKGKEALVRKIRNISSLASFAYVRQKEALGSGHAALQARHLVGGEPVAVMGGDDVIDNAIPALQQLIAVYHKYQAPVVALRRISPEKAHRYGVIAGTEVAPRVWKITGSVEKPDPGKAPSNLMVLVKYIFTPAVFDYLEKVSPVSLQGEISIPPAIDAFVKEGGEFYGYEVEGEYYDCGDKLGYMRAVVEMGLKHEEIGEQFRAYLHSAARSAAESRSRY